MKRKKNCIIVSMAREKTRKGRRRFYRGRRASVDLVTHNKWTKSGYDVYIDRKGFNTPIGTKSGFGTLYRGKSKQVWTKLFRFFRVRKCF